MKYMAPLLALVVFAGCTESSADAPEGDARPATDGADDYAGADTIP